MKRGFNKFSNTGDQEEQISEATPQPNPTQQHNYSMINQLTNFSPSNNGFSDSMIITLFQVVEQQSQTLQALMRKVEIITDRTVELTQKIKQIKKQRTEEKDGHSKDKSIVKNETMKTGGDILEASALIRILFGGEKKYEYRLKLAEKLDLHLYRQRNFFLEIQLCDLQGNTVKNYNKIPLSLALYTSENPPKFIQKNTAGQKILKGYIQQSLHQGVCRFQKIQIKEVTSHFRNGWIFIVIIPCMTPLGSVISSSDTYIDYTKIEPLVLDKIVVKAKKLKDVSKRDNGIVEHGVEREIQVEDGVKNEEEFYSDQK